MAASWVFCEQLGVWCNFYILLLDFSPLPPILGEMEKLPQISQKMWQSPHLLHCYNQTAQLVKTGKYSFERGMITLRFGEKYASAP